VDSRLQQHPKVDSRVFLMLNTGASGSSLAADAAVVVSRSYHVQHHGLVKVVTSGPTSGVIGPDGASAYLQIGLAGGAAELAQVALPSGDVLRVLISRAAQPTQASPQAIDGRYLLVALGTATPPKPSGRYRCGQLTALNVVTGSLSELPFPMHCSTVVPLPPLQAAWWRP
jgi:hypothetical protein